MIVCFLEFALKTSVNGRLIGVFDVKVFVSGAKASGKQFA